jgi:hypothetical protein
MHKVTAPDKIHGDSRYLEHYQLAVAPRMVRPTCLNMTCPAASVAAKIAKLRMFMNFCIGIGSLRVVRLRQGLWNDITDADSGEAE